MRIRWTETAAGDLTRICDYLSEHGNPTTARRIALRIYNEIGVLNESPHLGRPGRKRGTRELVLSPPALSSVYRIREDVIEINRILHGAQKWP